MMFYALDVTLMGGMRGISKEEYDQMRTVRFSGGAFKVVETLGAGHVRLLGMTTPIPESQLEREEGDDHPGTD